MPFKPFTNKILQCLASFDTGTETLKGAQTLLSENLTPISFLPF